MDISSVIKSLTEGANLEAISKMAKSGSGDVKSVLSSVASKLGKKGEKASLGDLTSLAGGLLGGKDGKNPADLLSSLLGKDGEEEVAKESGVEAGKVKSILSAASEKAEELLKGGDIKSALGGLLGGLKK